jgi:hypothetical protein
VNIELVGMADIDKRWGLIAGLVVKCLEKAPPASVNVTPAEVWNNVRSGRWQMLLAWKENGELAGITIWQFLSNGFYDCVILTGSALKSWLPEVVNAATLIAKGHGCKGLVATARRGLIHEIMKTNPQTKVVGSIFAWEFPHGEN